MSEQKMREALDYIAGLAAADDARDLPTIAATAQEALAQPDDEMVMVPKQPTEDQWSGLARDIVMWLSFERPTPAKLFNYLECLGRAIPDWMSDEAEMHNLDHVPSKGTRAVLVYKAMLHDYKAKKAEGA